MNAQGEPEHDVLGHTERRSRRPVAARPLRRARDVRVLAGVCGGIARFVDASPQVVRGVWFVSLFPSIGLTAIAYLLLWWLVPLEPPA